MRRGSFGTWLGVIVLAAATVRLAHVLAIAPATTGLLDGYWFTQVSHSLAAGHGFLIPYGSIFSGTAHVEPTAQHGPLYPLVLAAVYRLGVHGDTALRSLGTAFGALTVAGVGVLGRSLAGDAVGLVAAALAAAHPLLIASDGALLSETLYGALLVWTLVAAARLRQRPGTGRAALLGVGIGLAALTRSEALALVVLLAVPLAWRGGRRARIPRIAAAVACTVLVVSPWVVRNWSVFGRPLMTTNEGVLIGTANCRQAYHGHDLGYAVPSCIGAASGDESDRAAHWRRQGLDYAGEHAGRLVAVVAPVRLLREWTLYQPFRDVLEQGRSGNVQRLGIVYGFLLAPLAIAGLVTLVRRRRVPLLVLLAPVALASAVAITGVGSVRYRYAAEPSIVVFAAVGVMAAVRHLAARRRATVAQASMRTAISATSSRG